MLLVVWTADHAGYATGRSGPARGRLAINSSTSCSTQRTTRLRARTGFGNWDSAIRSSTAERDRAVIPVTLAEREKSCGYVCFLRSSRTCTRPSGGSADVAGIATRPSSRPDGAWRTTSAGSTRTGLWLPSWPPIEGRYLNDAELDALYEDAGNGLP